MTQYFDFVAVVKTHQFQTITLLVIDDIYVVFLLALIKLMMFVKLNYLIKYQKQLVDYCHENLW